MTNEYKILGGNRYFGELLQRIRDIRSSMKMNDWVQELDNQILLNRRKILEGKGKISHEEAIEKAEKEFKIYREREMKELQSDFDLLMKSLPNSNKE
ncbi:MAG: virulence RhuM family protein [Clostridia bacterium]|nr:virulence RhuM family protein [Clostridia bacterium]